MSYLNSLLPLAGDQKSVLPVILIGAAVVVIAIIIIVNIINKNKEK